MSLEGAFSPVEGSGGKIDKIVLVAADATEKEAVRRETEAGVKKAAEEQDLVVRELKAALGRLSDGDLTAAIETDFPGDYRETQENFNSAVRTLEETMGAVLTNLGRMQTGIANIRNSSNDLSNRTETQAATVEETAAALSELTQTVKETAQTSEQANTLSKETHKNAVAGGEVVRNAVTKMGEIEASSKAIADITSLIDGIAFQTNLLALNAGVEAARAGEAGRGFAVVASEVRALAQRSSEAAKEIERLIADSKQHVSEGVSLVNRTGESLEGIVGSVQKITENVEAISNRARDQAVTIQEVNVAVGQVDSSTQQNASMAQDSNEATKALQRDVEALGQAASKFQVKKGAGLAPAPAAAPARELPQPIVQQRAISAGLAAAGNAAHDLNDEDWTEF